MPNEGMHDPSSKMRIVPAVCSLSFGLALYGQSKSNPSSFIVTCLTQHNKIQGIHVDMSPSVCLSLCPFPLTPLPDSLSPMMRLTVHVTCQPHRSPNVNFRGGHPH
jgi:hypothetical protein